MKEEEEDDEGAQDDDESEDEAADFPGLVEVHLLPLLLKCALKILTLASRLWEMSTVRLSCRRTPTCFVLPHSRLSTSTTRTHAN